MNTVVVNSVFIHPDGTIRAVVSDGNAPILAAIGNVCRRRASHVWPDGTIKRAMFRCLRAIFGDRGRVACWCRTWRGPWTVRFADEPGKVVFTHPSRRVCIDFEIQQLERRLSAMK